VAAAALLPLCREDSFFELSRGKPLLLTKLDLHHAVIAAALFVIATALGGNFLRYGVDRITTNADFSVTRTTQDLPIVILWTRTSYGPCNLLNCVRRHVATLHGLYAREGISTIIGSIAGALIPYALLCAGGCLFFRRLSRPIQIAIATVVMAMAGVGLLQPVRLAYQGMQQYGIADLTRGHNAGPILLSVTLFAAALFVRRPMPRRVMQVLGAAAVLALALLWPTRG